MPNSNYDQIFVSRDPRVFPVNAFSGAYILFESLWFKKLDNGSTTNVQITEESGTSGFSGVMGFSGYSGQSATSGYSGTYGISGYSGVSATSGYSGKSGYSGSSATSGYSGVSGYSGTYGISGYSGYSGTGEGVTTTSESEDVSSTTSTTYQTKVTFSIPNAGIYLIHYCAEITNGTNNRDVDFNLDIGGISYAQSTIKISSANYYDTRAGVKLYTALGATTISIQYKVGSGNSGTAYIRNARITSKRIS